MDSPAIYRFGNFEFHSGSGEFRRGGVRVRLQGKPLQLLALLLERAPELVTREQMRERLWPADTFVDFDRNLNAAVKKVRQALDDSADSPRFVETMPRRGYRFIAPVELAQPTPVPSAGQAAMPIPQPPMLAVTMTQHRRAGGRALSVVAMLAALLTTSFNPAPSAGSQQPDCPPRYTLAVLPFRDASLGKDHRPDDHGLSEALTETLITRLAALHPARLAVISRRGVEKYRCSSKSVAEIGSELGAAYVVDGTVRREGSRLRVTLEFIEARDQTQIWSQVFDLPAGDPVAAQDQLAQELVKAVSGCLLPQKEPPKVAAHIAAQP
ncbi:MAG: winged helix-turn-helix domain-containing protein [Candidatus Acidiferrales bacterium]